MTMAPTMRTLKRVALSILLFMPISSVSGQQAGRKYFTFRGKIEQVNASTKRLVVNGEKVEGWMDAMTMGYAVDKPEDVLARVKVGDQIIAKVYEGNSTLYEVHVVPAVGAPASGPVKARPAKARVPA